MNPLSQGSMLKDRYCIRKVLGEGAMSTVYLVEDMESPLTMRALKEMREDFPDEKEKEEARALFHKEAELLHALSHEGLPAVTDFFDVEGSHYIVMEFVKGETLQAAFARRQAPYTLEELLPLVEQLLDILDYLHRRDPPVIFRDLKPSNIMVTPQGMIRLIDFGIARHFTPGKNRDTFVMGTPGFSAPEQYGQGQTDPRSDIYSLGATIYYLLTAEDVTQFSFNFPSATEFNEKIPFWMANLILKCLQKDPGARFSSAREMKAYLKEMKDNGTAVIAIPSPYQVSPASPPPPRFFMPYPKEPLYYVFAFFLVSFLGWITNFSGSYSLVWLLPAGFIGMALFVAYSFLVFFLALIFKNPYILRKTGCIGLGGAIVIALLIMLIIPNFLRARSSGQLTACMSNLKNIGTALEMYSSDSKGLYPPALSYVTPDYLKVIPTCPGTGCDTYSGSYVVRQNPEVYTVFCRGDSHKYIMRSENYPQYDSIQGLIMEYH